MKWLCSKPKLINYSHMWQDKCTKNIKMYVMQILHHITEFPFCIIIEEVHKKLSRINKWKKEKWTKIATVIYNKQLIKVQKIDDLYIKKKIKGRDLKMYRRCWWPLHFWEIVLLIENSDPDENFTQPFKNVRILQNLRNLN